VGRAKRKRREQVERPEGREGRSAPPEPGSAWSERRVFWVFAGAMALATLVFFASFVTDRGQMLFGTDMLGEAYQNRSYAVQEVQAGRGLPGWNPFVYAGQPFLSTLPYPLYYPTTLAYFVFPLHRAIGWAFVLHFLVAGLLAYALARQFGLKSGAAAVTGVAYMFTGYIVSHLYGGHDGRMFAMTLTPALFLFAERALSRRSGHWFLWMSMVVVLQTFTPHVQTMYFAAMAVGAYVLFRLVQMKRAGDDWKTVSTLLGWFVGAYVLAGLVALVEVWPTLKMLQFSHREARGYAYASSWALPVSETLAMIWPELQGYLQTYWGANPFKLHTEYVGAVPVFLALLALASRRSARVWFFAGLAVVGLLFAWGGATPVHRIFYWTLPVMKSFRAPAMMFSVVALSIVVLAGHGAQALYDHGEALADKRHLAWKLLAGFGVLWLLLWLWVAARPHGFAGFWADLLAIPYGSQQAPAMQSAMPSFVLGLGLFTLYWAVAFALVWAAVRRKLAPLLACALLGAVTVVDLWRVDKDFYATFPVSRLEADATVRFLQSQPGPLRVFPIFRAYEPNELMLYRLESVTGMQKFRLQWWDDLVGEDFGRLLRNINLWRLLDIDYVVSPQPLSAPGLEPVFEGAGRLVYRWSEDTPRAWVVYEAVVPAEGESAQSLTLDPAFTPLETAILEPGVTPPALDARTAVAARIQWATRTPDQLALSVESEGAGLLVLAEIYHPYWSASIDGNPVPVYQVDVALRGVPVPAGSHRVEMRFSDPTMRYGAWGSGIGILLLIGLLAATWRGRQGRAATPAESASGEGEPEQESA